MNSIIYISTNILLFKLYIIIFCKEKNAINPAKNSYFTYFIEFNI